MSLRTTALRLPCAALMAIASVSLAQVPESMNFKMDRFSVAAIAQTATGPTTYGTTVVVGQDSAVGATSACNNGFRTSVGYWSHLGDLPVPIQLQAGKSAGTMELYWSGGDSAFEVYRAPSSSNLVSPGNLYEITSSCTTTDSLAQAPAVHFYLVIPAGSPIWQLKLVVSPAKDGAQRFARRRSNKARTSAPDSSERALPGSGSGSNVRTMPSCLVVT